MRTLTKNIAGAGILIIFGTSIASAQVPSGSTTPGTLPPPPRPGVRDIRQETHMDMKDMRASTTQRAKAIQQGFRDDVRDIRMSSTSTSTRGMMISERAHQRNEDLRILRATHATSAKNRRFEARKELAAAHADRMITRFMAAIERNEKFITRIESRIAKIKAAGGNVGDAETSVAEAKASLALAKAALEDLKSIMDQVKNSENPQDGIDIIKDAAEEVVEAIKKAHEAIVDAVTTLSTIPLPPVSSTTPTI